MKVGLLAASLFLTSGLVWAAAAATITMSPPDTQNKPAAKAQPSVQPPAASKVQPPVQAQSRPQPLPQPEPPAAAPTVVEAAPKALAAPAKPPAEQPKTQTAAQTKPDCPCNCPRDRPRDRKANRNEAARPVPRYARGDDYRYGSAAPFDWHGPWRVAPNGAFIPGPMAIYEMDGLRIEDRGWTGGVGYAPDGGGGGGFVDGYGQVHFANGGGVENGPTYNSYGQSFPYNPSQAGPFQPRLMGGFAPPSR